jgi:hypothetical protein
MDAELGELRQGCRGDFGGCGQEMRGLPLLFQLLEALVETFLLGGTQPVLIYQRHDYGRSMLCDYRIIIFRLCVGYECFGFG